MSERGKDVARRPYSGSVEHDCYVIRDADGEALADLTWTCLDDRIVIEATGAYIVKACNGLDALLAACRHVEANLAGQSEETFAVELEHLRHAIAQAEEATR